MATDSKEKAESNGRSESGEKKGVMSKLPPWLGMALRKPRVWKTWVRCMVATFATMVLMLVQPCEPRSSCLAPWIVSLANEFSPKRPWPSGILWSNHVPGKIAFPSALMTDYPSLHGCWSIPDCNHYHDYWNMYGLGMGSSVNGRGSASQESSPTCLAASKGTGWVSHLEGES